MLEKNSIQILLVTCSLIVQSAAYSPAIAEGKSEAAPCTGLESRVKLLEDKAVKSESMKFTIGGWVNRAIQWADNGFHSNVSHISPGNVTSNIQLTGMLDPTPDFTLGTQIQIDFNQNGSASNTGGNTLVDVHRSQTNAQSEAGISIRQAEITADSKTWGKLSMGRGLMASSGVLYYTDLSGTYFFLHPYSSIGGISFRNKATGAPFNNNPFNPGHTLKPGISIFEHGDGGSIYARNDRIRYDSPNFYGFNVSTSHAYQKSGDLFDVALKFAAILAKYVITAQTSWSRNHTQDPYNGVNLATNPGVANPADFKGPKFDTYNGAVGVLTPFSYSGKEWTGLNFQVTGVHRKWKVPGQANGRALQGKVGYVDEFYPIGKTAFVVSYGQWKAMDVDFFNPANTMIGTNWGTGVVQTIDVVGTSIYVRYDNYKLKSKHSGASFKDVNIVYAGALVKL